MSSKKSSPPPTPPPAPSPAEVAQQTVNAQIENIPKAAQLQYDVLVNPGYGLEATTKEYARVRESLFPQENQIKQQLLDNIYQNLVSPTGISADQQAAVDARRAQAQTEVQKALRERANLGGGLFGGRSQMTEQRAVQDLQNQFAEEDITRQERSRLNAQQGSLLALQILFPELSFVQPSYIDPTPNANVSAQNYVTQRGQDANLYAAQQQANSAIRSSLFQALGNVGGSYVGTFGNE